MYENFDIETEHFISYQHIMNVINIFNFRMQFWFYSYLKIFLIVCRCIIT